MNQDINTEKAAEQMAVPRLRGEERSRALGRLLGSQPLSSGDQALNREHSEQPPPWPGSHPRLFSTWQVTVWWGHGSPGAGTIWGCVD